MVKIAVIPARAGSKGLKDKNIIDLCGKPLLVYSIEAAQKSGLFERIIVSTDSEKYGEISAKFGAEVMYRDEKLSNDNASTFIVLEDILHRMKILPDFFVLLQPTSPLRTEYHIREAVDFFQKRMENFDFLVSVKEAEYGNLLVKPIGEDGSLKYFDSDFSCYKRQMYKDYSPNGAIFIGKPKEYLSQKHFFGSKSLAYKMNDIDSIDIDNVLDYELAKICMGKRLSGEMK